MGLLVVQLLVAAGLVDVDARAPVLGLELDAAHDEPPRPSEEAADDAGAHGASDSPDAVAPMPGKVIEVLVDAGQSVSAGDPLVLVEAMKMEQTLRATVAGTVTEIAATAGAMVALGEVLVRVEPDTDD